MVQTGNKTLSQEAGHLSRSAIPGRRAALVPDHGPWATARARSFYGVYGGPIEMQWTQQLLELNRYGKLNSHTTHSLLLPAHAAMPPGPPRLWSPRKPRATALVRLLFAPPPPHQT